MAQVKNTTSPETQEEPNSEFMQALAGFEAYLRNERNASPHTVRNYAVDLADYAAWAQRSKVDALHPTHRQLRRYLAELDQARYTRTTINRHLSAVKSFMRYLMVAGIADSDPADVLMSLKKDKTLPHRISAQDMAAILAVNLPTDAEGRPVQQSPEQLRNQAVLEFLYACGARISEAAGLLTSSVDFKQGLVRVVGKGNKERIIPLHDMALFSMKAYLNGGRNALLGKAPDPGFFFLSTRGKRFGEAAIRSMFKDALAAAGVKAPYTPHDMRHTFASDVLEGGADLRSVQEMLGHASLSTTQIYTHLSPNRMAQVHKLTHPRG